MRLPIMSQAAIVHRLYGAREIPKEITCVSVWKIDPEDPDSKETFTAALDRGLAKALEEGEGTTFTILVLEHATDGVCKS